MEGGNVNTLEAIAALIERDGSSRRAVSERMGRSPSFITATESQARRKAGDAHAGTLAALAKACGHELAIVPRDDLPPSALVIDPPEGNAGD